MSLFDLNDPDDNWPCVVCGEPTFFDARSDCYRCAGTFHLRLTQTGDSSDCGNVWLDEDVMALQFACNNCLGVEPAEPAEPSAPPPAPEPQAPTNEPRPRRARPGLTARRLARRRR